MFQLGNVNYPYWNVIPVRFPSTAGDFLVKIEYNNTGLFIG